MDLADFMAFVSLKSLSAFPCCAQAREISRDSKMRLA